MQLLVYGEPGRLALENHSTLQDGKTQHHPWKGCPQKSHQTPRYNRHEFLDAGIGQGSAHRAIDFGGGHEVAMCHAAGARSVTWMGFARTLAAMTDADTIGVVRRHMETGQKLYLAPNARLAVCQRYLNDDNRRRVS